jgi:alginate O-acetyltransferase complex protein AlgJ
VAKVTTGKWPWPAKNGFVFQGREVELMKLDTFDSQPEDKRPFEAIVAVHQKLKEQGVDLIFVPLPDKLAIYPDYFADTAPADHMVYPAVKHLMKRLLENGVECVDLYPAFHAARKANEAKPLYYDRDSHWRNAAAQLAGELIAKRLQRYDFVQQALTAGNRYTVEPGTRQKDGDVLAVVVDAKTKAKYADDPSSPILITGDSNLMYNMGGVAAHMPAQIGRHIGLPLAFGPNTIPAMHYDKLAGKKVVIWANIARCLVGLGFPIK